MAVQQLLLLLVSQEIKFKLLLDLLELQEIEFGFVTRFFELQLQALDLGLQLARIGAGDCACGFAHRP